MPVKIWISGFSRAAAVANLTAGRLTRADVFAKEDVYAYTFATPAAVLNPPATGDENIFNILSPTDVVPQVMPAEWGYGRYGTDLWIPVPEFSSVGEGAVKLREMEIKNAFGTDIHYSASLNLRMRLLVSMVLDIMGSRDNYADNIQDAAVEIMQKKNASNMLTTMRNTLLSMKGSDRETRASLDMVLNYIVYICGADYIEVINHYQLYEKRELIRKILEFGASMRQISRLTGLSVKTIRLAQ